MIFSYRHIAQFFTRYFIAITLFLYVPFLHGSTPVEHSPLSKDAYRSFMDYIYDFSFQKADSVLKIAEESGENEEVLSSMKYNLAWWTILSGYEVDANVEKCDVHTDKAISFISKMEKPDINYQMDLINAYILKVRLENYIDNKISAIPLLFKALNRIKKLINCNKTSDRKQLVLGLYYYFVDYIDGKYILAGPVLKRYPEGNKELGLKYLKACLRSEDHFVKIEAYYFLYKIYSSIEKYPAVALDNIQYLHNHYPNNLVFSYELCKTMKDNNSTEYESFRGEILNQIKSSTNLHESQKTHFINLFKSLQ